ncbi:ribonuclease E activity regulator RraA [Amycolatopsis pigmentata]|uniref:4-hydroxy-4-methyl-2-oxoglutarate aldolase n=1 Tax=Amycolatopsis pigmentata TaxID=450801 RepID=A0ABW5FYH6_9PSEU
MNVETGMATCDLLDLHPELACTEVQFRDLGGRRRFGGRIRTLKCVDDTKLLAEVLAGPGEGCVLVVDGEASPRCALIGDRHAGTAARNGWTGVLVYGMARDSVGLGAVDIGVKALGVVPRRSGKTGRGEIDVPVTFGGVTFLPGGTLWADEDGVVVAPPGFSAASS